VVNGLVVTLELIGDVTQVVDTFNTFLDTNLKFENTYREIKWVRNQPAQDFVGDSSHVREDLRDRLHNLEH
jgi:hypothetical protein